MDRLRSQMIATGPVSLWNAWCFRPVMYAWVNRKATGMMAKATNVLTTGAAVKKAADEFRPKLTFAFKAFKA